jgi:hypothetical protein
VSVSCSSASAYRVSLSSNVVVRGFEVLDSSSSRSSSRSSSWSALVFPSYTNINVQFRKNGATLTRRSLKNSTISSVFLISGIFSSRLARRCVSVPSIYRYFLSFRSVSTREYHGRPNTGVRERILNPPQRAFHLGIRSTEIGFNVFLKTISDHVPPEHKNNHNKGRLWDAPRIFLLRKDGLRHGCFRTFEF